MIDGEHRPLLYVVAASLGWVLLVAGCGLFAGGSRQSITLAEDVLLYGDGRTLSVGVNSCNGSPTATIDEREDQVRIAAEAFIPYGDEQDSCADGLRLVLVDPLGDRAVVDAVSGQELHVRQVEE